MYDLAPGVTRKDFEEYARKDKIPTVRKFASTTKYDLYRVTGSPTGKPPYQYVGVLDVESMEAHKKQQDTTEYREFSQKFAPRANKFSVMFAEKVE